MTAVSWSWFYIKSELVFMSCGNYGASLGKHERKETFSQFSWMEMTLTISNIKALIPLQLADWCCAQIKLRREIRFHFLCLLNAWLKASVSGWGRWDLACAGRSEPLQIWGTQGPDLHTMISPRVKHHHEHNTHIMDPKGCFQSSAVEKPFEFTKNLSVDRTNEIFFSLLSAKKSKGKK